MSALSQNPIIINTSTCRACGLCGTVCPRHVTEIIAANGDKTLAIPACNEAFTAVTFGYPKYEWMRAVRHRLMEVRFVS